MTTQYLAGSTALGKNGTLYSLVHDTCAEADCAEFLSPLGFVYKIRMCKMTWVNLKTQDY